MIGLTLYCRVLVIFLSSPLFLFRGLTYFGELFGGFHFFVFLVCGVDEWVHCITLTGVIVV